LIQVFSQKWFEYYQKALLFYANTLGRDRLQIETGKRIVGIQPHSVTWQEDKHGLKSTAFYPRGIFGEQLRMDLWPFWKVLHSLDMSFLARKLSLNFGFDTLTRYPDVHPETDTVQGYVRRAVNPADTGETFATMRAGAGVNAYIGSGDEIPVQLTSHTSNADKYVNLYRLIALFNTSALTSGANITAGTYGVYRTAAAPLVELGDPNFCLVTSDPETDTTLVASDFQRTWGTTDLYETPFALSTMNVGAGRVTKNISAAGRALISKTGITRFGNKLGWDLTGDTTGLTWASGIKTTNVHVIFGSTTYAPCLIVTYTLPTVVSPAPVAVTFSLQAPAVTGKALVSPAPLSLLLGGVTPAVSDEELVLPNPVALALALQTPIVSDYKVVLPNALALVLTPQAPTISGKASIAPNPIALALTVQSPTIYAGTAYYVDATLGDDADPGTLAEPWKTVAKVNASTFLPNDQILFKCGEQWKETLTPPSSGVAGAPILFGSYDSGAKPLFTFDTMSVPRNIDVTSKSYLTFQNLQCYNGNRGMSFDTVDHISLYGCDIDTIAWWGIYFNHGEYIIIDDCDVTACSTIHNGNGGIVLYDVTNSVFPYGVHACDVHGNCSGILTSGSDHVELWGNESTLNWGYGFYFEDADYNLFHDNHSHHNIHQPGVSGEPSGCAVSSGCQYNEFHDNELDHNGDEGINFWCGGPAWELIGNKVYRNRIHDNDHDGLSFTSPGPNGWPGNSQPSDNEVYYNIIYGNAWHGVSLSAYAGFGTGNKLYNNTIVGNASMGIYSDYDAVIWDVKNNICAWNSPLGYQFMTGNNPTAANYTHDHNLYYPDGSASSHAVYYDKVAWACAEIVANFEATAVVTDPLFIDEAAHDYHLQGGSLAIGAGVDVGLTTDYDLVSVPDPPTMGAYEYIGDMTVYPAAMAMALTAQTPAITGLALISPGALSLLLGIQVPVVEVKILISPAALALALATQSPTIGSGIIISPAALAFVLALQAPIVSDYEVVSPVALNLALGVQVPTIGSGIIISPAALALALGVQIPAITGKGLISPAALAIALGVQTPAIAGKAEISPAAISLTLGIQTPTIAGLAIVTPAALSLALSMGAPTISGLALISPTALSLILGIEAPSVGVSTIVSPAALTLALGMESPTITGLALVSPGALAVTLAIQSPVITGLAVISPDAIPLVLGLQVPTIGGAALISPASLGITLGVQTETVTGAGIISPAALALSLGVPVVAVSGAALVSPAALSMALNAVVPTVEGKALISPAAINLLLGIQPATASGAALVSPGPVALTLGIPGVTVTGKALISPASIALAFAMGVPIIMIGVSGIIDFIAYVDCNILTDAKVDRNLAADAEVKH